MGYGGSATERAREAVGRAGACLVLLLTVAGCVVEQKVAFEDEQSRFARRQIDKGTGRVTGYAFFHSRTGRTYTAAGDWVTLIPKTPYAEERMRILYGDGFTRSDFELKAVPGKPDADYALLTRREKADIHGKFEFTDVMPGRWYVVATVRWEKYDRLWKDDVSYSQNIYDEIDVRPGETSKVVLSGR